jgi:superfamily I DNA/RNA helicase
MLMKRICLSQYLGVHNTQQRKFSDFAILYRTNSQTRAFEDALRRKIFLTEFMADCLSTKEKKSDIYWLT